MKTTVLGNFDSYKTIPQIMISEAKLMNHFNQVNLFNELSVALWQLHTSLAPQSLCFNEIYTI